MSIKRSPRRIQKAQEGEIMKNRLIKMKELKPNPFNIRIQVLPKNMVLLNPTIIEMAIIDLFSKELLKYMPESNTSAC